VCMCGIYERTFVYHNTLVHVRAWVVVWYPHRQAGCIYERSFVKINIHQVLSNDTNVACLTCCIYERTFVCHNNVIQECVHVWRLRTYVRISQQISLRARMGGGVVPTQASKLYLRTFVRKNKHPPSPMQ